MKVRSNFISIVVAALCAICALPFFSAQAVPRDDTQGESVYGVLDQLGPVVFNGNISGIGSLVVFWQNDSLMILKDGLPVVDQELTYQDEQIFLSGVILSPPGAPKDCVKTVQATFGLDDKGDLKVMMADWEGFDSFGLIISKVGQPTLGEVCVCYGFVKKGGKKLPCSATDCEQGKNCNADPNGAAIYCQLHAASVNENELSPSK